MEKAPIPNENINDSEILQQILASEAEVKAKIKNGEAYFIDDKDESGNLKTIRVFDSNTGELIFFKDFSNYSRNKTGN